MTPGPDAEPVRAWDRAATAGSQPTITAFWPQVTAQISHAIEYSSGTGCWCATA